MTQVRKRHALVGMKYDRVDLVGEGANGHADILIAKNRQVPQSRVRLVRKAMGTFECADCGTAHSSVKKSATCSECGSTNLNYTEVLVTKKVTPVKGAAKKQPKNDDATNAGQYTFEDEQYDQDNGENGKALGDAVERSVLNKKNWFEVDVNKADYLDHNPEQAKDGTDVGNVDNMKNEHEKEGVNNDEEQERLAETTPTGLTPNKQSGYTNTATSSSDSTMSTHKSRYFSLTKKVKKEKPGLNSWDHGDEGSQEVAESAEQMHRSESQPTKLDSSKQESSMSKVVVKARRGRKTNREGLDIIDHTKDGAEGIYSTPGVKRNGTGTGHNKHTTRQRTAVAPPGNPLDKGGVSKSIDAGLPTLEALNLGTQLAENISLIVKNNKPHLYNALMEEFVDAMGAAAGEWFADSSVTKSKDADAQAQDVAQRVYDIIVKASPASEMSDEASEGCDPDDMDDVADNSVGKLKTTTGSNKNEKEQTVVGKNKNAIFKSVDEDPYEGLSEPVVKKLQKLDELVELQTQEQYIQKARTLKKLPGFNEEKVAKQLRDAFENDEAGGEYLYQTLSAAANVTSDSEIFKQYGMPGQGVSESDPMGQAFAFADSHISKSGDGPSREQLVATYMKDHGADFYAEAKQAR